MAQKRKLRMKKSTRVLTTIIVVILVVCLGGFLFLQDKKIKLQKIGYSKEASNKIVSLMMWSKVFDVGENKTLNKAFESSSYQDKNFDHYAKIKYQDQKDLIKNINTLIKKGYKDSAISLILSRGKNEDVTAFAKREKVKYLEEFFSVKYSHLAYYDRYLAYQDLENNDAETTVLYVNLDFDKEDYKDVLEISKFNKYTLVNKHRMLTSKYIPSNLKKFPENEVKGSGEFTANVDVVTAFHEMREAALKDGKDILVNSAYRSYEDQEEVVNTYLEAYGQNYVDNYVAKAGFSEHQTGMGLDIASADTSVFLESDEYSWLMENAYKYGFILRYPKSKEEITGYKCEPWHYRYVGKKIAEYIKKNNITYDEYYVMFLEEEL